MNKSKSIIAVVIVAIIGTLIFWKRDWIKGKIGKTKIVESIKEVTLKTGITPSNPNSFPLKRGSKGEKVKGLQQALNRKYNAGLKVDGQFGFKTEKALKNAGFGKSVELWQFWKVFS